MAEERTIQNLYKFLYPIFPMIESRNANKKLRVKLENGTGIWPIWRMQIKLRLIK